MKRDTEKTRKFTLFKGSRKVDEVKRTCFCVLGLALMSASPALLAQTNVTNSNNGTTNTVPVYTGAATLGNSIISQSSGSVGINTTVPSAPLDVWSNNVGANNGYSHLAITSPVDDPNDGWGESELVLRVNNSSAPVPSVKLWSIGSGSTYTSAGAFSDASFWIWSDFSNGVPNFMIDSSNNVGIGGTGMNNSGVPGAALVVNSNGTVGIGTSSPSQLLEVNGAAKVDGALTVSSNGILFPGNSAPQTTPWTGVLCGGDYSEAMNAAGQKEQYQPGDVLVLASDEDNAEVQKSDQPYSTMVAGIIATRPGVIGKRQALVGSTKDVPMAMVGVVPTKVSAENGPIHRGDLLVSSSTPGYAMKGTDRNRLVGAVIGKAIGSLQSGKGVIEVLVTMQ